MHIINYVCSEANEDAIIIIKSHGNILDYSYILNCSLPEK